MKKLNYIIFVVLCAIISYVFCQNFEQYRFIIFGLSIVVTSVGAFWYFKNLTLKTAQLLFIGSFIVILFIPLLGKKETTSFEKRTLAPKPEFRLDYIWGYFSETQNYFSDRFAYRNWSVLYNAKFKFTVLNASPVPNLVDIGKDNWLFYTRSGLITNTSELFTPNQLSQVKQNLQIITKWFDLRGIKYYLMVAPIKTRIYPEMMDARLKFQFRNSKLAQLYSYLKKDTTIRLIDVREELINGKKIRPTYMKTDTHWNQFGAFLAYQKIMKVLKIDFPNIKIDGIESYQIDTMLTNGGDLQLMMGFDDEIYFNQYEFTNKLRIKPIVLDSPIGNNPYTKPLVFKMPIKTNPFNLFVVRDSYTEYLRIFLTPSFDTTFYAWTRTVPVARVMEQKSKIVLHEMLENFIMYNLILPTEIEADTEFLKKYFPNYKKLNIELNP